MIGLDVFLQIIVDGFLSTGHTFIHWVSCVILFEGLLHHGVAFVVQLAHIAREVTCQSNCSIFHGSMVPRFHGSILMVGGGEFLGEVAFGQMRRF